MEKVKPKQVWQDKADGRIVWVMAVVENYVMCRTPRKGAIPYLRTIKDFLKNHDRLQPSKVKPQN